jgi:hypothetical protein
MTDKLWFEKENQLKKSFVKVKGYLIRNPGAFFIITFDLLIFVCAFLLVGESPLVDEVAIFAYCFLVIGVILQAISFLKNRGGADL